MKGLENSDDSLLKAIEELERKKNAPKKNSFKETLSSIPGLLLAVGMVGCGIIGFMQGMEGVFWNISQVCLYIFISFISLAENKTFGIMVVIIYGLLLLNQLNVF